MTPYDKAVLAAIAKGPDPVGWYKIEQRLSMVALHERDHLPAALERLSQSGWIETSPEDREKYRVTAAGREQLVERQTLVLAWQFESDHTWLGPLKQKMDAVSPRPWVELDSDTKQ